MPRLLRPRPNKRLVYTSPPPFEEEYCEPQDPDREWEVTEILGWREDTRSYLVQWANADDQTFKRTWMPIENMDNCQKLIREFHQRAVALVPVQLHRQWDSHFQQWM
jgi:hypothetical protein